jgi:hypothetical protein
MRSPRTISVPVLLIVFAVGVVCAVVCPEETLTPHSDDHTCTQCISTHFMPDAKTPSFVVVLDANDQLTIDTLARVTQPIPAVPYLLVVPMKLLLPSLPLFITNHKIRA